MKKRHGIYSFIIFIVSWEIFSAFSSHFPSHIDLIKRFFLEHTLFLDHFYCTWVEMFIGLLLATLFAFLLAILLFYYPSLKLFLEPYFVMFQCIPMFVLAPVFIMLFGFTFLSVILPTMLMIAFPLTLSLYKGLVMTPKEHLKFFQAHGASKIKLFLLLRLPFAMPHFFSGLKIASATAGIGAIAGEWAGAQKGLGVLMQMSRRHFDVEAVFVCIDLLVLLSLGFYAATYLVEKLVFSRAFKHMSLSSSHPFELPNS